MNGMLDNKNKVIKNMIFEVRGKQVMLDKDLAKLYEITTGNLNKAKNRNIERFPSDFCFQLTKDEYTNLIFQNGISKIDKRTINKSLPYAYTEQGVAMLSAILKTKIATKISINIMRTFVAMRKYISDNLIEQNYINNMVLKHDGEIKLIQEAFESFKPNFNHLFFEEQIYDAYSLLLDIINKAKNRIIIIDNYADKKLLDLLSKTCKKVIIISCNMDADLIIKYMSQYNNIKIISNYLFHDRFIIIDDNQLYHCGASFKDLGKKCFAITKIEEKEVLSNLLKHIDI